VRVAVSLCGGKRAAALMSLIQSAKLNVHDLYEYLKDVLVRLPTKQARSPSCCRITGCRYMHSLYQAFPIRDAMRHVSGWAHYHTYTNAAGADQTVVFV
jgi:hypothetical protein